MSFPVTIPSEHGNLELANPIMIASGTYGNNGFQSETAKSEVVGGVVLKTVSMEVMQGNPEPIHYPNLNEGDDLRSSPFFLNSVGLSNPGLSTLLSWLEAEKQFNVPVILSIYVYRSSDFFGMLRQIRNSSVVDAIELNVSCPNVFDGNRGDSQRIADVVNAVKHHVNVPLLVKLAPNVQDFKGLAKDVADAGADALTICNTIPAMDIDVVNQHSVLSSVTGGMSGPGLRPIALNLVYQAAQVVDIPIIGVGGISSLNHVLGFFIAGASAVQIGTANIIEPGLANRLVQELEDHGTGWEQIRRIR